MSWFAVLLQVVHGVAVAGLVLTFVVVTVASVQMALDLRPVRRVYVPRHSGRS